MFKREGNSYYIEEFRELGIEALYTGADFPYLEFEKNRKIIHGYQTHSKNVRVISEKEEMEGIPYPDCDGLLTHRKDLVLYTKHADCLALYFYDRKREVVGLCHSGWKGSFQKIALEMVERFRSEYGSELEDILIGIGIGIAPENYQVSEEFYRDFKENFSPGILEGVFQEMEGKIFFHNERFNYNLLLDYGIPEDNLICSNLCTYRDRSLHSHRRDREKAGRNRAYIYINKG
ncbi:MAG: peptidoglycan editing factor PgeF [Fusobacteriaceae bacterium]